MTARVSPSVWAKSLLKHDQVVHGMYPGTFVVALDSLLVNLQQKSRGLHRPRLCSSHGQRDLFAHKGIHVCFMNHTHQAGVLGLDDLVMMVG